LGGRGIIKPNKGFAIDPFLQNRKILPDAVNLSTGQKLNGAELGVKERLGRSNEKAA